MLWLAGNEQAAVHQVFYTFPFRPSSSHHFRGTHSILQNDQCVAAQVLKKQNNVLLLEHRHDHGIRYKRHDLSAFLFCFVCCYLVRGLLCVKTQNVPLLKSSRRLETVSTNLTTIQLMARRTDQC